MNDSIAHMPPTRRADLEFRDPAIRSALRRGKLIQLRRGVLVGCLALAATRDEAKARHALLAKGAILAAEGPPAFACLGSAGLLHEFKRLGQSPQRVRLYRRKGPPWRDGDVAVLTCGLPDAHLTEVMDVPCTTGPRTVVDLARWVAFRGGVVVADSAMRLGVERQQLSAVAKDCTRWPGIRKARDVIAFADGRAASPLESISRVAFRDMGLPSPELQVTLAWDDWGNPRIIVDFYWPEFGVVGEADGLLKYDVGPDEPDPLRAEKLRQEELEGLGYIVVRWTWDDIWRRPDWVATRLRNAFAAGARRRRST
jgi:hypothetical protein